MLVRARTTPISSAAAANLSLTISSVKGSRVRSRVACLGTCLVTPPPAQSGTRCGSRRLGMLRRRAFASGRGWLSYPSNPELLQGASAAGDRLVAVPPPHDQLG